MIFNQQDSRQTHCSIPLIAIVLIATTFSATAEISSRPQPVVDDQSFRLNIITKTNDCGLTLEKHWPDGEPVFLLGVTDAFSLDINAVQKRHKVADWHATWKWTTSKSCGHGGRDTCKTPHENNVQWEEYVVLGENLKIEIAEPDGRKYKVDSNKLHRGVATNKGSLSINAALGEVIKPNLSPPHPSAKLTKPLCAEVQSPSYLAAQVTVKVIRRHP